MHPHHHNCSPNMQHFFYWLTWLTPWSSNPHSDLTELWLHGLHKKSATELLNTEDINWLWQVLARMMQGHSVAHILGNQPFYQDTFLVNQSTLIPRSASESLIPIAQSFMTAKQGHLLDVGTGTGNLVISLAKKTGWQYWAMDCSQPVINLAKRNAKTLNSLPIKWIHQDHLDGQLPKMDLIISNPPYLSNDQWCRWGQGITHEPKTALIAGATGYELLYQIARQSLKQLKPKGTLLLEHGANQANPLAKFLKRLGYQGIKHYNDLSGHQRFTKGVSP